MKKQTIKIKYPPLQKVQLISGTEWYIECITLYSWYFVYKVWDWWSIYMHVEEWQIAGVVGEKRAGFRVQL